MEVMSSLWERSSTLLEPVLYHDHKRELTLTKQRGNNPNAKKTFLHNSVNVEDIRNSTTAIIILWPFRKDHCWTTVVAGFLILISLHLV
jgi:hypothetical protein